MWTSLEGPSLSLADALTISCSLGTGAGISWKQSLCPHSYEINRLVVTTLWSILWSLLPLLWSLSYLEIPLCLIRLVLSACVHTHFIQSYIQVMQKHGLSKTHFPLLILPLIICGFCSLRVHMCISIYGAMLYSQVWDSTWIYLSEWYTPRSSSTIVFLL